MLREIIEHKRKEIEKRKKIPLPPSFFPSRRDFKGALLSAEGVAIIGELKRRSPSKGMLRECFEPCSLAKEMEEGGASALSVLTDERFFGGSLSFLPLLKKHVNLPLLMKDFLIDEFQIEEAHVYGADAVLLIARILTSQEMKRFLVLCEERGIQPLVEIHSEEDWEKIKDLPLEMVGINSRDLETFQVDVERVLKLRELIPQDKLVVAESGIKERKEIERLREAGIKAVLIGEALMRAPDVRAKLRELIGDAKG